jgi:hypothetical protein
MNMRKQTNEDGFSAVEAILILIVVAIIGFAGWFVWHSQQATSKTLDAANNSSAASSSKQSTTSKPSNQTQSDPYAGWKSYTLANSKISFKYPSAWQLSDSSGDGEHASDMVSLKGNNDFSLNITVSDTGHPGADYTPTVVTAQPVNFAGNQGYLDFVSGTPSQDQSVVYSVALSQSKNDPFDVFQHNGNNILVEGTYKDGGNGQSASAATSDPNYANTKLLVESISY